MAASCLEASCTQKKPDNQPQKGQKENDENPGHFFPCGGWALEDFLYDQDIGYQKSDSQDDFHESILPFDVLNTGDRCGPTIFRLLVESPELNRISKSLPKMPS
jgi:hypothetical protein